MQEKRVERVEIRFYRDKSMESHICQLLEQIADRNNMSSLAEAAKYVLTVFVPAAALTEEFDLVRLQQKAIDGLASGKINPSSISKPEPIAATSDFAPITGF